MNIYDPYPGSVVIDGAEIPVNLAYDRVLKAIDAEGMPDLTIWDLREYQCSLFVDPVPSDPEMQLKIISAVFDLLPKGTRSERAMDLHQDAAMFRSGFMRAYGIDLTREKPHILQFLELLADLPRDTALVRTVELRLKPIPKPTKDNAAYIAELQKAKARVALAVSDEERRSRFAESLKNSTILKG